MVNHYRESGKETKGRQAIETFAIGLSACLRQRRGKLRALLGGLDRGCFAQLHFFWLGKI